jgi:hypothetical protein
MVLGFQDLNPQIPSHVLFALKAGGGVPTELQSPLACSFSLLRLFILLVLTLIGNVLQLKVCCPVARVLCCESICALKLALIPGRHKYAVA